MKKLIILIILAVVGLLYFGKSQFIDDIKDTAKEKVEEFKDSATEKAGTIKDAAKNKVMDTVKDM